MPELPDVELYVLRARERLAGQVLRRVKLSSPFVLRTALPPLASAEGRRVGGVQRLGKRIVLELPGAAQPGAPDLWLVMHLMIAGRLRWLAPAARPPGRITLALLEFDAGTLALTEAGSKRRASLHLVDSPAALAALDAGGIDARALDSAAFTQRLQRENHTLKRALTDPRLFSGIGNAYSDEILHRARLSPLALTKTLADADAQRLHQAVLAVLGEWTARLAAESPGWPGKVTAFHPQMAVHGRHGQPCPVCASPVQRIVYADNECNYCARCQTGGRLLADRALSRLLKASWPKTLDDA
ncbi:MAG: Fpg/Nei family DNA glycosylase [Rubrivivax sp.]|nr:Fpg/Nei family DNA glycosylase [Rubrivivax sp.]